MHNFISEFDVWLAVVGGLVLLVCLFGVWYLFKDKDFDEIDTHEEILCRILDKGDNQ